MDSPQTLICPNCKKPISIDQALKGQLEDQIKQSLRDEFNKKWIDEKKKIEENAGQEIKKDYEERLQKQKEQLQKAEEYEKQLRKTAEELEEKGRKLELEIQRQIDQERKKIREKTEVEIEKKFHLKEKEKEQMIESLKRSLEDAQRKANQGSQQTQGEILELELEELLRREFPYDEILSVAKGITGADVIQKVKDSTGRDCGVIIWESKRTKNWTEGWIPKLKDDMRRIKADVAIIVSTVLPEGVKNFETRDGVHIASFEAFLGLAKLIRLSLIDLQKIKLSTVNKNNKMEILYSYLSSNEFAQRFEAIIEAFTEMKGDLEKEKQLYTKVWAKREKQIQRVVDNTIGMHGDLQGLMGSSLPEIKVLEIEGFGVEDKEDDNR